MKHSREQSPIHTLPAIRLMILAVLLLHPGAVHADVVQAQEWTITADKMTRYENPPSIIAEGNVILEKTEKVTKEKTAEGRWEGLLGEPEKGPGQAEVKEVTETKTLTTIKADWIAYDVNMGKIRARGNLFIEIGPDRLTADGGEVNLNTETGTFTDASIVRQYKDLHLTGKVIEKTGDMTYHIQDGWVITCKLKDNETPPWSFAAKDARITDGGYAILKHTTFRVKDVPLFYSPWMVLPVKRSRQTGFLFPGISASDRDGFGIELPFFYNLSPSSDITVYPEYMSKRGLMTGLEFRYIKDQESKGSFMANYLYDELTDPSEVEYYKDGHYTHTNKDRYWVRGKADQNIAGWITRLDLDIVSDRDYLTEFTSGLTGFNTTNDRFLDVFGRGFEYKTIDERTNTLRVVKYWQNMSLEGELLGINDVRINTPSPTPLWMLPSFNFTGLIPVDDTQVNFDWDAGYVNYWREDGVGAHRFDLYPRLSAPIPLSKYLETTAELGVRDTAYLVQEYGDSTWNKDDLQNRLIFNFETEVGTTLVKDFGVNISDVHSLNHTFRPYVSYQYIPDVDQSDLPKLDNVDLVTDQNMITYGIDNFFKIFGTRNDHEFDRDYGTIKISQDYSLRSEDSDEPLSPVHVKIWYWPLQSLRMVYKTDIDVYGKGATFYNFEGSYWNSRGDSVGADYRYDQNFNTNSITANAKVNLFYNLIAAYSIERSIANSKTVAEIVALIYKAPCWSVQLSSDYTPGNQKFMVTFRLANIGTPLGIDLPGI